MVTREQVLSEIRRVAEGLGKPPGRAAFERETGIKQSEWRGVYWARWGDALAEGGLTANQWQRRLDPNFILRKMADAARHYGRLPTEAELRMYSRIDPDFPAHGVANTHFGSKAAMVARLRQWTADDPAYTDVAAMLPQAAEPERNRALRAEALEGWVYLIQSGLHYKIGRSDQLERRVKEIRITLPDTVTMVHAIKTDDPAGIEAYWHRRFADKRAKGEWFRLGSADVAAFKRRKYQ